MRKVSSSRLSDNRAPLVNLIDYVRQKLGESYLRANRAPLVNQIDYVRVWEKVISEPILLCSSIEQITSNDEFFLRRLASICCKPCKLSNYWQYTIHVVINKRSSLF